MPLKGRAILLIYRRENFKEVILDVHEDMYIKPLHLLKTIFDTTVNEFD